MHTQSRAGVMAGETAVVRPGGIHVLKSKHAYVRVISAQACVVVPVTSYLPRSISSTIAETSTVGRS